MEIWKFHIMTGHSGLWLGTFFLQRKDLFLSDQNILLISICYYKWFNKGWTRIIIVTQSICTSFPYAFDEWTWFHRSYLSKYEAYGLFYSTSKPQHDWIAQSKDVHFASKANCRPSKTFTAISYILPIQ